MKKIFAYEMRNALAHGYFKVDLAIVWKTVETDLPPLHQQGRSILDTLIQVDLESPTDGDKALAFCS